MTWLELFESCLDYVERRIKIIITFENTFYKLVLRLGGTALYTL